MIVYISQVELMVLSPRGALFGFNVRLTGNAWTWILSLSALCVLLPSSGAFLFSLSLRLVLSCVSYQELVFWSGPELSSGCKIRCFFPSGCMRRNTTKVPVRAGIQKRAPNGAVIMMYSLQDNDVRRRLPPTTCSPPWRSVIFALTAGQLPVLSAVRCHVWRIVCAAY